MAVPNALPNALPNDRIDQGDLQDQKISSYRSPLGVTHTQTATIEGFTTESGFRFDQLDVSYQTLGTLSPARDNAILICHALSGDAHVAGMNPKTNRPGWWDYHVGPGKGIDTDKFFVICSNALGGCAGTTGPASSRPDTGKPYAMSFPAITIRDMVAVQTRLIEQLGISQLFGVTGASMGGMQALVWAAVYPERVRVCVPLATCTSHSAMQIAFNEIGRRAIRSDPHWNQGSYFEGPRPAHGLAVARMVGHVTYLSAFSMTHKFGRKRQAPSVSRVEDAEMFAVESYLEHQGESFVKRFDPKLLPLPDAARWMISICSTRAKWPKLSAASRARFLVISFESDWLYPPASVARPGALAQTRGNVAVTYINLDTPLWARFVPD